MAKKKEIKENPIIEFLKPKKLSIIVTAIITALNIINFYIINNVCTGGFVHSDSCASFTLGFFGFHLFINYPSILIVAIGNGVMGVGAVSQSDIGSFFLATAIVTAVLVYIVMSIFELMRKVSKS